MAATAGGLTGVLCVSATVSLARAWLLESAHASADCRQLTVEMKPGCGQGVLMVRMPTSTERMQEKKDAAYNYNNKCLTDPIAFLLQHAIYGVVKVSRQQQSTLLCCPLLPCDGHD